MTDVVKKMILLCLILCFAVFPVSAISDPKNDPIDSRGQSTSAGRNALVEEMLAHDSAFGKIVSAVALSDSDKVHRSVLSMHSSMDKTREGVRSGSILLPKNASRIADFVDIDLKFRDKLDALDRAARHHNQREMQRIVSLLLSDCVKCHRTFRK
jgi:cytochrome c556